MRIPNSLDWIMMIVATAAFCILMAVGWFWLMIEIISRT